MRFYPTEAMKPSFLRQLAFTGAAIGLLLAGACAGPHRFSSGTDPTVSRSDSSLPGGSAAHWSADYRRLTADIPRAVRNLDWAMLRLEAHPPAGDGAESSPDERRIVASVLLPNERRGLIDARPEADGRIRVAIRVGRQGDVANQRRFLAELARVLRGKPAREYRGRFEAPK